MLLFTCSQLGSTNKKRNESFNNELQLMAKYKHMLLALVDQHSRETSNGGVQDIISDKGRSIVILLYSHFRLRL